MRAVMKLVSPLAKVFLDEEPVGCGPQAEFAGFQNETISFQAAYRLTQCEGYRDFVRIAVDSPLPGIRVRRVLHVPVGFATFPDADARYLRRAPGLYPDLLRDLDKTDLRAATDRWESVWVDVRPEDAAPGAYPVRLTLCDPRGAALAVVEARIRIAAGELPPQSLKLTRWLHCDCLAQYYGVEMWSERFWRIAERFVRRAVEGGVNMILTPVHTPPLDTARGGERMTCQLADIFVRDGGYSFAFDRLERWVRMCERAGVRYFEIAHLFTQWGAACAPKLMGAADGEYRRLFGWETPAQSLEYRAFLEAYLPALTAELRRLGVAERCFFHVSDEPTHDQLAGYRAAHALIAPYLRDFRILDALSDLSVYRAVPDMTPVVASNHIEPFLREDIAHLWAYYCVGQYRDVSNQFIAMPSVRQRILGAQLYKHGAEGFLHWGYNFYNSQFSHHAIDPYATTDGDGFAPGGDTFIVYPGADDAPEDSLRLMIAKQAVNDHRALTRFEAMRGRDAALQALSAAGEPLTFGEYPQDEAFFDRLRAQVRI